LVHGSENNLRYETLLLNNNLYQMLPSNKNGQIPTNSNYFKKQRRCAKCGDKLASKNKKFQISSSHYPISVPLLMETEAIPN